MTRKSNLREGQKGSKLRQDAYCDCKKVMKLSDGFGGRIMEKNLRGRGKIRAVKER